MALLCILYNVERVLHMHNCVISSYHLANLHRPHIGNDLVMLCLYIFFPHRE